jgi:hypothetical protein
VSLRGLIALGEAALRRGDQVGGDTLSARQLAMIRGEAPKPARLGRWRYFAEGSVIGAIIAATGYLAICAAFGVRPWG